ncbi:MAG: hypothetical protein GYA57_06055, partial [Myxococcales bacterium]|nr:hypothetical protein [Myxococcales bacterium]
MAEEDRTAGGMWLAEVLLPLALPGTLTYRVPDGLVAEVAVGAGVTVPLGRRRATGFIAGLRRGEPPPAVAERLRDVIGVARDETPLEPAFVRFLVGAARYYFAPPGEALRVAFPRTARGTIPRRRFVLPGRPPAEGERLGTRQRALLAALSAQGEMAQAEATRELGATPAVLRALAARGLVRFEEREPVDPFAEGTGEPAPTPAPTPAQ